MNNVDFLNLSHMCAIGIRKMLLKTEKKNWEVYARLTSGNSFALNDNLSRKAAKRELIDMADTIMNAAPISFVRSKNDEDLIPMGKVARVYVDTQLSHYVVMVEDASGTSYLIRQGQKEECEQVVRELTLAIMQGSATSEGGP